MRASAPFEWMIGIGALVALPSMGRPTKIEMSDRVTAIRWLVPGMGVPGWAVTTRLEAGSASQELVLLLRPGAGTLGAGFALLGLRRLRRSGGMDRGVTRDLRHDLASELDRSASKDFRRSSAWGMVYAGGAVVLILFAVNEVWDETVDGSPETLVLLYLLALGLGLVGGRWRPMRLRWKKGQDGGRPS